LSKKQKMTVFVLMAGAVLSLLNQSLLNPMLPEIMVDTNVDATTAQWLASGFILVSAIAIAVTAFLMDRFTTKRIFVGSFLLFLAGSLLCAWAPNFPVLLIGRLLQGFCSGIMMPMTMTILLLFYPPEKRGSAMGTFSLVIMYAPAVGPALSGIVIDSFGWQMTFLLVAAIAVVILIAGIFSIQNAIETKQVTLDKSSLLLCSFGLLFLLYGFSSMGHFETIGIGIASTLVGVVILFFFVRKQLRMSQPFLQVKVLKNRRFLIGTVLSMILSASMASTAMTLPLYVQTVREMSATVSGLVMMPGAMIGAVCGFFSGKLYDRFGPYIVTITGVGLLAIGSLLCAFYDMGSSIVFITASFAIRNIGISISNTPISTWSISKLDDSVMHHGNSVANTLRQAASTACIAIMISIMSLTTTITADQGAIQSQLIGIQATFWASLALVVVALIIVLVTMRSKQ
jgi:EmrB/QacA subfamily drug resistance transporter